MNEQMLNGWPLVWRMLLLVFVLPALLGIGIGWVFYGLLEKGKRK